MDCIGQEHVLVECHVIAHRVHTLVRISRSEWRKRYTFKQTSMRSNLLLDPIFMSGNTTPCAVDMDLGLIIGHLIYGLIISHFRLGPRPG